MIDSLIGIDHWNQESQVPYDLCICAENVCHKKDRFDLEKCNIQDVIT